MERLRIIELQRILITLHEVYAFHLYTFVSLHPLRCSTELVIINISKGQNNIITVILCLKLGHISISFREIKLRAHQSQFNTL